MKTRFALAGVLLFLCVATAFAQWAPLTKAHVPFEFTIGNTAFPAGNYVIQTQGQVPSMLRIVNVDTQQSAMVFENDILLRSGYAMANKTKLVFSADGNRHVLHQVVIEIDDHVHDIVHGTQVAEVATSP
jgi:hypothetical protein